MIILVAGTDDAGRDDITEMVLHGYKGVLPRNELIKAAGFMPDFGSERDIGKLQKMRDNALSKLQKEVVSKLKEGGNIVLAAGLSAKTMHGYMPAISKEFVDSVRPDLIIFMEILPQRVESYMEHEHVDWSSQRFERQMASLFSIRTGAPLRVVKVRSGAVKGALKETADAFRAAMG